MWVSLHQNRLVVKPERRRPLPPASKCRNGRERLRHRSAEPAVAWTHLQQLGTPRPPRSAELFRDARCKSVGWLPVVGCAFALAALAGNRSPMASVPLT